MCFPLSDVIRCSEIAPWLLCVTAADIYLQTPSFLRADPSAIPNQAIYLRKQREEILDCIGRRPNGNKSYHCDSGTQMNLFTFRLKMSFSIEKQTVHFCFFKTEKRSSRKINQNSDIPWLKKILKNHYKNYNFIKQYCMLFSREITWE